MPIPTQVATGAAILIAGTAAAGAAQAGTGVDTPGVADLAGAATMEAGGIITEYSRREPRVPVHFELLSKSIR